MAGQRSGNSLAVAASTGFCLWLAASWLSHQREPWDSSVFWFVAYPLAILACALLGYKFPRHSWRWVVALFASQFAAMCVLNQELGNLWPLGLALFAVMALPGFLIAKVAARFGAARNAAQ